MKFHIMLFALLTLLSCNYSYSKDLPNTLVNSDLITIKSTHDSIQIKKFTCRNIIRGYFERIKNII